MFYFAWSVLFLICGCVLALVAAQFRGMTGYGAASVH